MPASSRVPTHAPSASLNVATCPLNPPVRTRSGPVTTSRLPAHAVTEPKVGETVGCDASRTALSPSSINAAGAASAAGGAVVAGRSDASCAAAVGAAGGCSAVVRTGAGAGCEGSCLPVGAISARAGVGEAAGTQPATQHARVAVTSVMERRSDSVGMAVLYDTP